MTTYDVDRIVAAAQALADQPLYVLSTAGQELFHSNMLYWLAKRYPEESAPVWQVLGLKDVSNGQQGVSAIEREYAVGGKQKVDLFFAPCVGAKKLVLENKVLTLPTTEQLDGYFRAPEVAGRDDHVFTLLTLVPTLPGLLPEPWRACTYDDLVGPLKSTAGAISDDAHAGLVRDYTEVVRGLVALRDAVRPTDPTSDPWFLPSIVRTDLRDLRVLSFVEKIRGTFLAIDVDEAAADRDVADLEVGLSNSTGHVSYMGKPLASGHKLGWQMQGDKFRLSLIVGEKSKYRGMTPRKRRDREQLAANEFSDHFEFSLMPSSFRVLAPANTRKEWLGYKPAFVYRYEVISPSASWADVVALCVDAVRHVDRGTKSHS